MTRFEKWLEVAQKHPFGYATSTQSFICFAVRGLYPEFSIPQEAMPLIHSAILMARKGVVWFDENGAQIGASAYQGYGERYIWIGADMGKPKGEL